MPSKIKKQPGPSKAAPAVAVHAADSDGVHHVVGIGNIRVVIVPDGKFYFAQGLEIDYAAQGATVEEVKSNFEVGLTETIEQHLRIYGNIKKILTVAPVDVWHDVLFSGKPAVYKYSQFTGHEIHEALPYEGIMYLVAAAACG